MEKRPEVILTPEHRYFVDGVEHDGVTSVLRAEGFMSLFIPADLDWYLDRGTKIHRATELWDRDILDESAVDPRIAGYLESWKKYRYQQNPAPVVLGSEEAEIKLCDPLHRYAGTLDRIDCDIKSGQPERWHIFQIAAYAGLARVNKLPGSPNKTVYLQEDGSTARVIEYSPWQLRKALQVFLCALTVHRAKKEMGHGY